MSGYAMWHATRDESNFPALDMASRIDVYDAPPAGRNLTDERTDMPTKKPARKLKKGKKLAATKPLTQSFLKIKSANTSFLKSS
jgi:hypothetical protein